MKKIYLVPLLALFNLFGLINSNLRFELQQRDRCFIEQTSNHTTILIRYEIYFNDNLIRKTDQELEKHLNNIRITIYSQNENKQEDEYFLYKRRGKHSKLIENSGNYKICIKYSSTPGYSLPRDTYAGLSISVENEPDNIESISILQKDSVASFQNKLNGIKKDTAIPLNTLTLELQEENKIATEIIKSSRIYYICTIGQIIIIILIIMFHIINFRRFLASNKIV